MQSSEYRLRLISGESSYEAGAADVSYPRGSIRLFSFLALHFRCPLFTFELKEQRR